MISEVGITISCFIFPSKGTDLRPKKSLFLALFAHSVHWGAQSPAPLDIRQDNDKSS